MSEAMIVRRGGEKKVYTGTVRFNGDRYAPSITVNLGFRPSAFSLSPEQDNTGTSASSGANSYIDFHYNGSNLIVSRANGGYYTTHTDKTSWLTLTDNGFTIAIPRSSTTVVYTPNNLFIIAYE